MIRFKFKLSFLFCALFFVSFPGVSQTDPGAVLSQYIKYKSVSGDEKQAGMYIKKVCEDLGFCITVFSDTDSSFNFCASLFPLDHHLPSVVLINHIDVVSAMDGSSWQFPPFSGKIRNDTIFGRGALDMKGPAIMQVFALKKIRENLVTQSVKKNICILFLSGEETGGKNGAAQIILPHVLPRLNPFVVIGEGGGGLTNVIPGKEKELCFFISTAEKKSVWIKLEAVVKSHGHGSVPSTKNANKLLLKAISRIENTEERIVIDKSTKETFKELGNIIGGYKGFIVSHIKWWIFKPFRKKIIRTNDILKTLVTNSYQLTQIQNPSGSVNQVAQTATAYYDCRLLPNKSQKPLLMKWLFRIVDPRIKISIIDESPEAEATKPDGHYKHLSAAITSVFPQAHVIPVLFPATTDNSYFRSVNIPAYGLLPFQLSEDMIESVHAGNEHIPLKAIDDGIAVYTAFLQCYIN